MNGYQAMQLAISHLIQTHGLRRLTLSVGRIITTTRILRHDARSTIACLTAVPGDNEELLPLKQRVLWRFRNGQEPKT